MFPSLTKTLRFNKTPTLFEIAEIWDQMISIYPYKVLAENKLNVPRTYSAVCVEV